MEQMMAKLEENKNDPSIWVPPKFGRKIKTVEDAYDFLHNHPKAYDHADKKEWEKLSLKDRWLVSNGQFIDHMSLYIYKGKIALETGPVYYQKYDVNENAPVWTKWANNMHDIKLDVYGEKTFEKALIKLAKKVRKYYGNY